MIIQSYFGKFVRVSAGHPHVGGDFTFVWELDFATDFSVEEVSVFLRTHPGHTKFYGLKAIEQEDDRVKDNGS